MPLGPPKSAPVRPPTPSLCEIIGLDSCGPLRQLTSEGECRFFTCCKPIPVDNLPVHLRCYHGVQNQEMLEFHVERAKDSSWADRA